MDRGKNKQRKEKAGAEGDAQKEKKSKAAQVCTRRQTGIRILATLFFVIVVWSIVETILFVAIVFQIVYALIAEKPNEWVAGFANRTIVYLYRVMRYLTFNEERVPFPFSRFPGVIEK